MHHDDSAAPPAARPLLRVEYRAPNDLKPDPRNARTHSEEQVRQIRASIDEFGFTNPILLREDATIGAGHGRHAAALLDPRLEQVPTITLHDLTEAQWRAYVIADNKLALNAGWDEAALQAELDALVGHGFDLEVLGFDQAELDAIFATADASGGRTDPDAAPDAPAVPASREGDLWLLGRHRLLVGDATSIPAVDLLMEGRLADLVWTDPPYNVAVEGKAGTILNDNMGAAAFRSFLGEVYDAYAHAMRPGAVIYVAHAESERAAFTEAFTAAGLYLAQVRIWVKQSATLSRSDFNWQHEPIIYGWKPGAGHYFAGDFTLTTIFERDLDLKAMKRAELLTLVEEMRAALPSTITRHDRPTRSDLHPTMKPVALITEMIEASSRPGEIILDLFGGSGSTLIAAEQTARSARLMELDPRFADVIVRRWEEFTGRTATLQADGRTFREVHDERRLSRQKAA